MQPTTAHSRPDTRGDHPRAADHSAPHGHGTHGVRLVVLLACATACLLARASVTTSLVGVVLVALVLADLERAP